MYALKPTQLRKVTNTLQLIYPYAYLCCSYNLKVALSVNTFFMTPSWLSLPAGLIAGLEAPLNKNRCVFYLTK